MKRRSRIRRCSQLRGRWVLPSGGTRSRALSCWRRLASKASATRHACFTTLHGISGRLPERGRHFASRSRFHTAERSRRPSSYLRQNRGLPHLLLRRPTRQPLSAFARSDTERLDEARVSVKARQPRLTAQPDGGPPDREVGRAGGNHALIPIGRLLAARAAGTTRNERVGSGKVPGDAVVRPQAVV